MGSDHVEVALRDSSHPDLVHRAREEGREGGAEGDGAVTRTAAHRYSHHVLLGNEALYKAVWEPGGVCLLNVLQ